MWRYAVGVFGLALGVIFIGGCVERYSGPPSNSDRGYLFIDLEEPIAAGWESEVLILGPATGRQICDSEYGCYSGHRALDIKEIWTEDDEVLEVLEFEQEKIGRLKAVRVRVKTFVPGEATLYFAFSVDGMEPGEGEESVDEEGNFVDSFLVQTKEAVRFELERLVDEVDPSGPYGQCPRDELGVYLMDSLDSYEVYLRFLKLDEDGERLRGSGEFPFSVEPEGALEVVAAEESTHLVRMKPLRFGEVSMVPEGEGSGLKTRFMSVSEVEAVEVRAYELGLDGGRGREVNGFVAGANFELAAHPRLGDLPLCGGSLLAHVESLTPAICEPLGAIEARGSVALTTYYAGECMLRLTAPGAKGGQGLVETLAVAVEHNF